MKESNISQVVGEYRNELNRNVTTYNLSGVIECSMVVRGDGIPIMDYGLFPNGFPLEYFATVLEDMASRGQAMAPTVKKIKIGIIKEGEV